MKIHAHREDCGICYAAPCACPKCLRCGAAFPANQLSSSDYGIEFRLCVACAEAWAACDACDVYRLCDRHETLNAAELSLREEPAVLPPRRRFVALIEIGADSVDEAILVLEDFVCEARLHQTISDRVVGGSSYGYTVRVDVDETVTHESYHAKILEWLKAETADR